MIFRDPVEPAGEGEYRLRLSDGERELLRALPAELRALLDTDPGAPALRRLFPPAHAEDAEAEAGYRELMGAELLQERRAALALVEETAGRDLLTAGELDAWLRALTDLRLVLGTRLGVTEETYAEEIDPTDPRARELAVFAYLTWLQEALVAAVSGKP
ncbi:MAG TPA: DUF2017 family protein [Gaiellaceae bacterium]|nr:DUF2017 family protein [Gaiellaceae bacterium]